MKKLVKLQLLLCIGGPIAFATGYCIGYGTGKLVCTIVDKLTDC